MKIDSSSSSAWKLSQSLGERTGAKVPPEADRFSALEFDPTGEFLATGDRGGRVTIFSKNSTQRNEESIPLRYRNNPGKQAYNFYSEFQSHEAEFDYLKSLEIEEKINKIKWCKSSNNALYLLSTNDKTIKLWKIYDKKVQVVSENNSEIRNGPCDMINSCQIRFPKVKLHDYVVTATPRRVFSNAHAYHINSIAINSDGEHYLSADDLRINLWSMEISKQSFNIVDIKPTNMDELTEVITAADFHPTHCNIMMYSSSRGSIRLGDMRQSALCDLQAKVFEEQEDPASKSFFSEIIASISDIKFSLDGRYIISRDYLTLKIWDVNMESRPVQTIEIHEQLRPKLCDLYESDCIFDKFECSVGSDGNNFVTGSYNNTMNIYDRYGKANVSFEVSKSSKARRYSVPDATNPINGQKQDGVPMNIDYTKKILHTAWHPHLNQVAVASGNGVYIYDGSSSLTH